MKTTKMLTILVLALAMVVCLAQVGQAEPMGTAFTYQGRLIDANKPADGLYDFQFKLFDANAAGSQQGGPIDVNELDVIDGYFTVELDFGSEVFNGDARWLEILVRPGDSNDVRDFVTLSPRQEVTLAPYAIYAKTAGVAHSLGAPDGSTVTTVYEGNVGIGTTRPTEKLHVAGNVQVDDTLFSSNISSNSPLSLQTAGTTRMYIDDVSSYVGIGTTNPLVKLHIAEAGMASLAVHETDNDVVGQLQADTDYVSLHSAFNHPLRFLIDDITRVFIDTNGNVGIGTTSPESKLHLGSGDILLGNDSEIKFKDTVGIIRNLFVWDDDEFVIENNISDDGGTIRFHTKARGGESVRITSDGKLGIGTTDPNKELEVVGNAHIEGNVTWKSKMGYISVSAAAFRPRYDGYDFQNTGYTVDNMDDVSDHYYAPVQLPHGATLTEFTYYWKDSSLGDGTGILVRSKLGTGYDLMAQVWTIGSSGTPSSSSTNTINYATIDNSQYAYFLGLVLPDEQVTGYGMIIEYTFTESY